MKENLVIVGPTGSGKSSLALEAAKNLNGELIGCDSVQVYKGFDIGSSKDQSTGPIPHHLTDLVGWDEEFDAANYAQASQLQVQATLDREKLPIIVGGTGLYLRAFWGEGWHGDLPKDPKLRQDLEEREASDLYAQLETVDPVRAKALHPNDKFRVVRALEINHLTGSVVGDLPESGQGTRASSFVVLIVPPRPLLHQRIAKRTKLMLKMGLVDEVKGLLEAGVDPTCKPMQSIGYRQTVAFLQGQLPEAELEDRIIFATRQYAKRQLTWFKSVEADLVVESPDFDVVRQKLPKDLLQFLPV
jgi:tRNA dimethylallyltransferase